MNLVNQLSRLYKNNLCKAWGVFSGDVGNYLINLGALGWLLSSTAQIQMILFNKKLDRKTKEFLIPQEATDAAVNVGFYYLICTVGKNLADSIIEKGYFLTQKTFDAITKMNPSSSIKNYLNLLNKTYMTKGYLGQNAKTSDKLTNFFNGTINVLEDLQSEKTLKNEDAALAAIQNKLKELFDENPILKNTFEKISKENKINEIKQDICKAFDEYKYFKNGVGVFSAVLFSVIACSVITPIARNYTASYYQKEAIKKDQKQRYETLNNYPLPMHKPNVFKNFRI